MKTPAGSKRQRGEPRRAARTSADVGTSVGPQNDRDRDPISTIFSAGKADLAALRQPNSRNSRRRASVHCCRMASELHVAVRSFAVAALLSSFTACSGTDGSNESQTEEPFPAFNGDCQHRQGRPDLRKTRARAPCRLSQLSLGASDRRSSSQCAPRRSTSTLTKFSAPSPTTPCFSFRIVSCRHRPAKGPRSHSATSSSHGPPAASLAEERRRRDIRVRAISGTLTSSSKKPKAVRQFTFSGVPSRRSSTDTRG